MILSKPGCHRVVALTGGMAEETTTVTVRKETWKRLHLRKEPGDSFDDVISELIEIAEESEKG